jgi:hypothetical protein
MEVEIRRDPEIYGCVCAKMMMMMVMLISLSCMVREQQRGITDVCCCMNKSAHPNHIENNTAATASLSLVFFSQHTHSRTVHDLKTF